MARIRKTTFSNSDRFLPEKLNYTQECADRSLIDAERQIKKHNSTVEWEKSTNRNFVFLNREQMQVVEER